MSYPDRGCLLLFLHLRLSQCRETLALIDFPRRPPDRRFWICERVMVSFRIHFQLRQQRPEALRSQNLASRSSAPSRHPEQTAETKIKETVRGDAKSLSGRKPRFLIAIHENRKGEPLPGWSCP